MSRKQLLLKATHKYIPLNAAPVPILLLCGYTGILFTYFFRPLHG
jgi:hypothetical protein